MSFCKVGIYLNQQWEGSFGSLIYFLRSFSPWLLTPWAWEPGWTHQVSRTLYSCLSPAMTSQRSLCKSIQKGRAQKILNFKEFFSKSAQIQYMSQSRTGYGAITNNPQDCSALGHPGFASLSRFMAIIGYILCYCISFWGPDWPSNHSGEQEEIHSSSNSVCSVSGCPLCSDFIGQIKSHALTELTGRKEASFRKENRELTSNNNSSVHMVNFSPEKLQPWASHLSTATCSTLCQPLPLPSPGIFQNLFSFPGLGRNDFQNLHGLFKYSLLFHQS